MMLDIVLSSNHTSYMWIMVMVRWRRAESVSVISGCRNEKVNRAEFPSVSTSLEGAHTQEILAHGGP